MGQGLADDCNARGFPAVLFCKESALEKRNPHGVEKVRVNESRYGPWSLAEPSGWTSLDHKFLPCHPKFARRDIVHETSVFDSW